MRERSLAMGDRRSRGRAERKVGTDFKCGCGHEILIATASEGVVCVRSGRGNSFVVFQNSIEKDQSRDNDLQIPKIRSSNTIPVRLC